MSLSLDVIGTIVLLISGISLLGFLRHRTPSALVRLCGSALLLVMVLTHIAEQFRLLPSMGWGRPGTAGHYVDLVSAFGGLALYCSGLIAGMMARSRLEHHLGQ